MKRGLTAGSCKGEKPLEGRVSRVVVPGGAMKEARDFYGHASGALASGLESPSANSFAELYQHAEAEKFGLTLEEYAGILREIGSKYLPTGRDTNSAVGGTVREAEFYAGLHLEELALARACAKGCEWAWEVFLGRYREKLYAAARSMVKEESLARELADSLYSDLYGVSKGAGPRNCKLNSYTGRGSLEGWLRAVLAQAYVDRRRSQRRLVSLDEQAEAGVQFRAQEPDSAPSLDARLQAATDEALSSLAAEDRLVLASYYLDGRTLAEIARMLGVHESTISRRVEKITTSIRKRIIAGLLRRGMSRAQAEEALEADVRDLSVDIGGCLRRTKTQERDH